jgi:hypothetical protein
MAEEAQQQKLKQLGEIVNPQQRLKRRISS